MAKYFKPETDPMLFFCPCCGNSIIDHLLLTRIDNMRELKGAPIWVNSGFRCKKHNAAVGGNPNSEHMDGKGADLRCTSSMDRFELIEYALQVGFRRIGIGNTFVHVGSCKKRPQDVIWVY